MCLCLFLILLFSRLFFSLFSFSFPPLFPVPFLYFLFLRMLSNLFFVSFSYVFFIFFCLSFFFFSFLFICFFLGASIKFRFTNPSHYLRQFCRRRVRPKNIQFTFESYFFSPDPYFCEIPSLRFCR